MNKVSSPWRLLVSLQAATLLLLALLVLFALLLLYRPSNSTLAHMPIFERVINDAAAVDKSWIVRDLFAINEGNHLLQWRENNGQREVKVVAWMSDVSYRAHYATPVDDCDISDLKCDVVDNTEGMAPPEKVANIWVTLVPQLKDFCSGLAVEDPEFRLKQWLGLDPNLRYDRFVEMWVPVDSLFRPCADPETNDNSCQLSIDRKNPPQVKGISNYARFYQYLIDLSYTRTGAPWTRLGYTYDWAYGERGVGGSEYIITPTASFSIFRSYDTVDYCDGDT